MCSANFCLVGSFVASLGIRSLLRALDGSLWPSIGALSSRGSGVVIGLCLEVFSDSSSGNVRLRFLGASAPEAADQGSNSATNFKGSGLIWSVGRSASVLFCLP